MTLAPVCWKMNAWVAPTLEETRSAASQCGIWSARRLTLRDLRVAVQWRTVSELTPPPRDRAHRTGGFPTLRGSSEGARTARRRQSGGRPAGAGGYRAPNARLPPDCAQKDMHSRFEGRAERAGGPIGSNLGAHARLVGENDDRTSFVGSTGMSKGGRILALIQLHLSTPSPTQLPRHPPTHSNGL